MVRHFVALAGPLDKNSADNLNYIESELKNAKCDIRIDAGRFYLSLFEQESRDQVAKFVSPEIALSLTKDHEEA